MLFQGPVIKFNVKKIDFHFSIWWGTLEYTNALTEKKTEK